MTPLFLLVFARCAGFISRAPGFSHPAVPRALRAGAALALTAVVAPGVRSAKSVDGYAFVVALAVELALGSAIGLAASLMYDGAYAGGRMLDDYVGLKAIAPNLDLVAPSGYGRLWSLVFTGAYFMLAAYRPALLGFAQSFERIVPGAALSAHAWGNFAATCAGTIVLVALAVAGPAIALAFVTQVALGAIARTIPRFATFGLSFPLVFAAVLLVTAIAAPLLATQAARPFALLPQ